MDKELGRHVVSNFISTDRLHRKTVDSAIKQLGLHRSQHILLMHLNKYGDALSQKKLAEHLGVSPTAVAVKIKKLESDGFIERKKVGSDSRINHVKITEKGMEIVKKTECIFKSIDNAMINGITPKEIDAFICCTKKMRDNLENFIKESVK